MTLRYCRKPFVFSGPFKTTEYRACAYVPAARELLYDRFGMSATNIGNKRPGTGDSFPGPFVFFVPPVVVIATLLTVPPGIFGISPLGTRLVFSGANHRRAPLPTAPRVHRV